MGNLYCQVIVNRHVPYPNRVIVCDGYNSALIYGCWWSFFEYEKKVFSTQCCIFVCWST